MSFLNGPSFALLPQITIATVKLDSRQGCWAVSFCWISSFVSETYYKMYQTLDHIISFVREGNQGYGCDVYE